MHGMNKLHTTNCRGKMSLKVNREAIIHKGKDVKDYVHKCYKLLGINAEIYKFQIKQPLKTDDSAATHKLNFKYVPR